MIFKILPAFLFIAVSSYTCADVMVTFEELTNFTGANPAGGGSFYNGNNGTNTTNSNGWSSQGVFFNNTYNSNFGGFWNGWSYSNVVNTTTVGFTNQYAAFPGGGSSGVGGIAAGQKYAMASGSGAYFNLPTNMRLLSVDLTNATYAALSMQNGDSFAKKFGGATGNDPDLFGVSLRGFDNVGGTGNAIGSVNVNLGDFRFANNSQDYILNSWINVDLASIADARSVSLSFFSTDTGAFGINTPTYLALDNLRITAVPEPSSLAMLVLIAATVVVASARSFHGQWKRFASGVLR